MVKETVTATRLGEFKENTDIENWDGFPELMWKLGFDIDGEKSFEEFKDGCSYKLIEPHSERERKKNNLYMLEHAPVNVVGNYLFSHL